MRDNNLSNIFTLQFWGICLVVLGHSFPYKEMPYVCSILFKWIYSFHMPLFFAMSGYLYKHSLPKYERIRKKDFLLKKIKRLVLPFLCLNLAIFPIKILGESLTYRTVGNNWSDYIFSFLYLDKIPIGNLWFVIVLFIIFLIFRFMIPRQLLNKPLLLLVLFLTLNYFFASFINSFNNYNIWGWEKAIYNSLYFYIGILIFDSKNKLKPFFKAEFSILGYVLILIYVLYFDDNIFITPFIAIIGILSSFALASFINIYDIKIAAVIAQYSYQIYLLSWFPQVFIRILFSDRPIVSLPYYLIVILSFILGTFIPLLIAKSLQKRKIKVLIGL